MLYIFQSSSGPTLVPQVTGHIEPASSAKRISTLDFSSDIGAFEEFLGGLQPVGGGDAAEDVAGGLEEVRRLFAGRTAHADYRILMHVADCPGHGRELHVNSLSDDFPDGDPAGLKYKASDARVLKPHPC